MDDFDIKTLPADFVPVSTHSDAIRILQETSHTKYDEKLNSMYCEIKTINIEIDAELKEEMKKIKLLLNGEKEKIGDILSDFKSLLNKDILKDTKHKMKFGDIAKDLEEVNTRRIAYVEELRQELERKERKRSERYKLLLKETYQELEKIPLKSPYVLKKVFHNEILNINKIIVSNCKTYTELEKELKLQILYDNKMCQKKLLEIKEDTKKLFIQVTSRHANFFKDAFETELKAYKSAQLIESEHQLQFYQSQLLIEFNEEKLIPIDKNKVSLWLKDMQIKLASLDKDAQGILDLYKSFIITLFNRYFEEFSTIKLQLFQIGMIDGDLLDDIHLQMYTPSISELNIKVQEELDRNNEIWNKYIEKMKRNISETFNCLNEAAYLWDNHFERLNQAREVVLTDVQNTVSRNINDEKKVESEFNLIIDRLRQSSSVIQLKQLYEGVKKQLDKIANENHIYAEREISALQKYTDFVEIDVEVFMAELKMFLVLHPPDEAKDPKKQRKMAQTDSIIVPSESLIPTQIIFCEFQVDAVKNWMFGLWEAIQNYMHTGREEIMEETKEWVDSQVKQVKDRLAVRMDFHKLQYERVNHSIYEYRLRELMLHSSRLDRHKLAVEKEIDELNELQNTSIETIRTTFQANLKRIEDIFNKSKQTYGSKRVIMYICELEDNQEDFRSQCHHIVEHYETTFQDILEKLKISHFLYLKAIGLFSENANYHPEEARLLEKSLQKIMETLSKQRKDTLRKVNDVIRQQEKKVHEKSNEMITKLKQIAAEFEFNENAVKVVKTIKKSMLDEITAVKTKFSNIQTNFKQPFGKPADQLSDRLVTLSKDLNEVLSELQDFAKLLKYTTIPELSVAYPSKMAMRKARSDKDFDKFSLHSIKVDASDVFLERVINLWKPAMRTFRRMAENFYSHHTVLYLHSSKLQPTQQDFLEEIHQLRKTFLKQAEDFWEKQCSEALNILNQFSCYLNKFLKDLEDTFYNRTLDEYRGTYDNIMYELEERKKNTNRKIDCIYKKLKTLYGHPNNKKILRGLEDDFNKFFSATEQEIVGIFPNYKETLACEQRKHEQEQGEVQKWLNEFYHDKRLESAIAEIRSHHDSKPGRTSSTSLTKKISKDHASFTHAKTSHHKQSMRIKRAKEIRDIIESESSNNIDCTNGQRFLQQLETNSVQYLSNIQEYIADMYNQMRQFKELWGNEINIILNLYKLGSDELLNN